MCLITVISFSACNPGEQPAETTGNQTTINQNDAPPAEDLPEAFSGMYTKENATGIECLVIYDNNQLDIDNGTATFVDDAVYYICGNKLYSCKNTQEPEVIATDVADYAILDSGCYYIGTDDALYLAGTDKAVDAGIANVSAY